jgi:hypothetical protein
MISQIAPLSTKLELVTTLLTVTFPTHSPHEMRNSMYSVSSREMQHRSKQSVTGMAPILSLFLLRISVRRFVRSMETPGSSITLLGLVVPLYLSSFWLLGAKTIGAATWIKCGTTCPFSSLT